MKKRSFKSIEDYFESLETFNSFKEFEEELKSIKKEKDVSLLLKKMDDTLYKNKNFGKTFDWHYLSKIVNEKVRELKKASIKKDEGN